MQNIVLAVQCSIPENPGNGKAVYTSLSFNSVVIYECKYGYMLVGEGTRRCGPTKRWSGIEPQCKGELEILQIIITHILVLTSEMPRFVVLEVALLIVDA